MLTGDEVKAARSRARMTQEQAATNAGVTVRTWGSWERSGQLTPANEARVREVLTVHLSGDATPLADVSDAALLAEIAARFDRSRRASHGTPTTRAGESPAPAVPDPSTSADDLTAAAEVVLGGLSPEAAEAAREAERLMHGGAKRAKGLPR